MGPVNNPLYPEPMKKSVKTLVLITTCFLFFHHVHAQLKLPNSNGIGNDLRKVISDYPNHFSNLLGEMIEENVQYTDYECNFTPNGAEKTTITHYSSKGSDVYSWQTVMLTTDNFEKAKQKFRTLYNQLNNLTVKAGDGNAAHLRGQYIAPAEEKKFNSIVFSLDPADDSIKKLKAEITLEFYAPMEWRVKVLVYDRDREDNERGKTQE